MRKSFGKNSWLFPLPVLLIGTYNEDGSADVMTAAWGGIYDTSQVFLCLSDNHKTTKNILREKSFTISFGDVSHVKEADYVGMVSGNQVSDKVKKAGLTPVMAEHVHAPYFKELPVCVECSLWKVNEDGMIIGNIVDVSAEQEVLTEGKIDCGKFHPLAFDPSVNAYRTVGEKVGQAFGAGREIAREK